MTSFKSNNLSSKIELISTLLQKVPSYELSEEYEQIRSTYSSMLHYMIKGIDDPNSRQIYTSLHRRCHVLFYRINRIQRIQTNDSEKYTTTYKSTMTSSLQSLFANLKSYCEKIKEFKSDFKSHIREVNYDFEELIQNRQDTLSNIFKKIWSSDVFNKSDYELLTNSLESDSIESYDKSVIVSGVTLALLEMFDEKKMMFLFDSYNHPDVSIRMRAIVGIVLCLRQYNYEIKHFSSIESCLSLYYDSPDFINDIFVVLMQLEYSTLTSQISEKMRNDIIPSLLQSGKFKRTELGLTEIDDYMTQNGENPEWHHIDKSDKAYSKLQEMMELQMDGADVYMSTFHYLKNDLFFNDISNWFMPFSLYHPHLYNIIQNMHFLPSSFKELLVHAPFCSSDKYSFAFMLNNTGEAGQSLINKSLSNELNDDELKEHVKDMKEESNKSSDISRQYIQDLYRFFTIYPFHYQFNNPFDKKNKSFSPLNIDIMSPLLSHSEDILRLADFYMRKEQYKEALDLYFSQNPSEISSSPSIWQKIGFCQQKSNDLKSAYNSYCISYSLDSNSSWTLKHLAHVSYQLKQYDESEAYYDLLLMGNPDNIQYLKRKANCLTQSKRYSEAIPLLYKIYYLDETCLDVEKELAFCQLMSGNFEKSKDIYIKLTKEYSNDTEILMNLGNVYYCLGDLENSYKIFNILYNQLSSLSDQKQIFKRMFVESSKALKPLSIDMLHYQMMYDSVIMTVL